MAGFQLEVADWTRRVKACSETVFKESIIELVKVLDQTVPVDTGFLRASLTASTSSVPLADLINPGNQMFTSDLSDVIMTIKNAQTGEKIYLGYRADYWAFVHYGSDDTAARPWVALAVQRWPVIVANKAREVKQRLGL